MDYRNRIVDSHKKVKTNNIYSIFSVHNNLTIIISTVPQDICIDSSNGVITRDRPHQNALPIKDAEFQMNRFQHSVAQPHLIVAAITIRRDIGWLPKNIRNWWPRLGDSDPPKLLLLIAS